MQPEMLTEVALIGTPNSYESVQPVSRTVFVLLQVVD